MVSGFPMVIFFSPIYSIALLLYYILYGEKRATVRVVIGIADRRPGDLLLVTANITAVDGGMEWSAGEKAFS